MRNSASNYRPRSVRTYFAAAPQKKAAKVYLRKIVIDGAKRTQSDRRVAKKIPTDCLPPLRPLRAAGI